MKAKHFHPNKSAHPPYLPVPPFGKHDSQSDGVIGWRKHSLIKNIDLSWLQRLSIETETVPETMDGRSQVAELT
ncbi:hypothetical protein GUITHDRAFT_151167 [Guillardia theta CCMP2712]|uniref:Uncharacterized protein n=1 Tax=Guillardia theta (strain CCMP2712) TaxID=905079 RepID=L1JQC0_GUITC|nr:hypothetical protein GUITHDRAFT_151167 [Guillardia theta CCMP2712]EKX50484.1 hypothetical protein GUITHDRAFT_151167 [Guillardia theta CCMP2712]|eukprot:XP_005837464.1 hypothetical protein GUITHDRAFT_151167 [Guillardia theta CCMP2712]